ncbi:MAG TPA: hypothetical protein VER78_02525 [Thermoanaerobaculia bacterium]|nr:hypothetical protein [Thermoanaerobaculia bacterium]
MLLSDVTPLEEPSRPNRSAILLLLLTLLAAGLEILAIHARLASLF